MTTLTEAPPAKGRDTDGGHYYGKTSDGRVVPCHEVIGKNGRLKSCGPAKCQSCSPDKPERTIYNDEQVEVVRIVPSVTTILKVLNKPALKKYHEKKVIAAVEANPRFVDESDDDYYERVVIAAEKHMRDAGTLGTKVHKAIEAIDSDDPSHEVADLVSTALEEERKLCVTITDKEVMFFDEKRGYGGTVDRKGHDAEGFPFVGDFKNRGAVKIYPTDAIQVSAYGVSTHGRKFLECGWGANIVVSTTEPGKAKTFRYDTLDMTRAFDVFCALHSVWAYVNKVKL